MSLVSAIHRLGSRPTEAKALRQIHPRFNAGQSARRGGNLDIETAVSQGLKLSGWVYRLVNMTAESASTVPFGVQLRDQKGNWSFDWTHPVSNLLGYWNDDNGPSESVYRAMQYLQLGGNALAVHVEPLRRGVPFELDIQSPVGVEPIVDGSGTTTEYRRENTGSRWPAEEVVHARLPDPSNPYWGLSKLVAIAREVDTDVTAQKLNKAQLEEGGVPDGLLLSEAFSFGNEAQRAAVEREWAEAKGPMMLGPDTEWVQMGLTPRDLQYLQGREFSMRAIIIGLGYHPALFGADATFNNTEQANKEKWVGAVLPLMSVLAGALTRSLIPRGDQRSGRVRVWYDTSGVEALRYDLGEKVKSLDVATGTGMPYDTAKDLLGIPVPDLDAGLGQVPMVDDRRLPLADAIQGARTNPL